MPGALPGMRPGRATRTPGSGRSPPSPGCGPWQEPVAADAALEEALTLVGGADAGPESWGLIRMRAILALDSDKVTEARDQVAGLLAEIGEFAGVEEVMATLVSLTRIQVRSGHCREALRTAARCSRAMAETGVQAAPALYAAALAATAGGTADEARHLAEQAVRASEADGDRLFLLRALAVLGQAELLVGDPRGRGRGRGAATRQGTRRGHVRRRPALAALVRRFGRGPGRPGRDGRGRGCDPRGPHACVRRCAQERTGSSGAGGGTP